MFLAYIRLIFRGSFIEITTAILLVYKILKMPLDVLGIDVHTQTHPHRAQQTHSSACLLQVTTKGRWVEKSLEFIR
jgi:hypothetical protein